MPDTIGFTINDAVNLLRRTPDVLRAMLAGLPDAWIRNNYGAETFSPFDVVGHLIHGEEADWIPRLRIILEHGATRDFDPFDRYAMYEKCKGRSLAELLDEFAHCRRASLDHLTALKLTDVQLDLRGRHPEFGQVTARQLLATWVAHDLNHIHQVAKCLAFQYRVEIGPWRPFLGVYPKK